MLTEWGETLDREHPLPEYPRPQLVRDSYLNLNGPWSYAITKSAQKPQQADGTIIVPFSPESELSGVGRTLQPDEYLWYIRSVELPAGFNIGRVLLHFGAVDQTATVWCNGVELATHTGGYLPFTVDLTEVLGPVNTILVCVRDLTDRSLHTRGKQKLRAGGIWYPPQSGIWQTVWLESVPNEYIRSLKATPHFDERLVEVLVDGSGKCVMELDGKKFSFPAGVPARVPVQRFEPWTPERPVLYPFSIQMGQDTVYSYFAMRKCSVETDETGVRRLYLNNRPYFHNGLLDQGYWSDGLYTAPSDEALLYDIQTAKAMGFNMLRKHMKVEPDRWYYHCDRLGMLVWQDMPCGGGRYDPLIISAPLVTHWHLDDSWYPLFGRANAAGRREFLSDLREMVSALYNHPCIVLWVPFNEGWGQFDSLTAVQTIEEVDRTRTIDPASGWHDQGFGGVQSLHVYFRKYKFKPDKLGRAVLLSEFGGYTHRVHGHTRSSKSFGYKNCAAPHSLEFSLQELYDEQIRPAKEQGLAAAVYTQLSDVETELNGLITYDRRKVKLPVETLRKIFGIENP